jgi:hypothetical protein
MLQSSRNVWPGIAIVEVTAAPFCWKCGGILKAFLHITARHRMNMQEYQNNMKNIQNLFSVAELLKQHLMVVVNKNASIVKNIVYS